MTFDVEQMPVCKRQVTFLYTLILLTALGLLETKPLSAQAEDKAPKGALVIPPFEKKPDRVPSGSLKSRRMIFSDEEIRIARTNVARFPEAARVRDAVLENAGKWMSWEDQALYDLLSDARVPRAFELNPGGCPVHGDAVFKKGGTHYPWIIDPAQPFKVKCPVGHEVYPSNDYESYYKSGFKAPLNREEKYADDGWGWLAPDGERYWFVAYANQWLWMDHIKTGIPDLARAYLLTGEKRYAHKALVMLYRMAEVYPSMDHEAQSRYGLMSRAENRKYPGKVVNHIWECFLIQDAAQAYDMVWDAVDEDMELQRFLGKSGMEIRAFIEANLLEEAIDAYQSRQIDGNFGMHQVALLNVLLARQHAETGKYIRMLVDEPGEDELHTGIRFALYNLVFRDGIPMESPSYNTLWISKIAELSELLKKGGTDLFEDSRLKKLFDAPIEIVATGLYTPDWGDSGSTLGDVTGRMPDPYQTAYANLKDPAYLTWLAGAGKTEAQLFSTFGSLFREALPPATPLPDGRSVREQPSRLFAGYGLGILNNVADKTAIAFTYGMHLAHYHYDLLNFELFANKQKMMPDLGYPDGTDGYIPGRFTWSNNTASHNTVVVDARKQRESLPGILHDFSDGVFARSMDASSPAYEQTSQYRRNMVMIDVSPEQSYVVDFFNVTGGNQHDYILHGPPGSVSELTGTWGSTLPGTLAGENVALGEIYDDEKLGAKDYTGMYTNYKGSGFQHFFNVQQLEKGNSVLEYVHISDPDARLRIHIDNLPGQTIFRADAYDLPRAKKHILKYLIVRRKSGEDRTRQSTFVSVLEPFSGQPYIRSTRRLHLEKGLGLVVEVTRENALDVVMNDTLNTIKQLPEYGVETDANSVALTFDKQKRLVRVFYSNGTYLKCKDRVFRNPDVIGTVTEVDVKKSEVKVRLEKAGMSGSFAQPPSVVHFSNPYGRVAHPLAGVVLNGKRELTLKMKDDLLTGRVRIESIDGDVGLTRTILPFAPAYGGATLLDQDYRPLATVKQVRNGKLNLNKRLKVKPETPADCWVSTVGVGDKMVLKSSFSLELKAE